MTDLKEKERSKRKVRRESKKDAFCESFLNSYLSSEGFSNLDCRDSSSNRSHLQDKDLEAFNLKFTD